MLGRDVGEARTISLETGVQNVTLGLAIAGFLAGGASGINEYGIPGAVYGILMYLIALPAIYLMRRAA